MEIVTIIIMIIGILLAVKPSGYGTTIMMLAVMLYWLYSGQPYIILWVKVMIFFLFIFGEFGTRILREYLTKDYNMSRLYCVNTTAANLAAIAASDVILGPITGIIIWEIIVGKSWLPRFDIIAQIIGRLSVVFILRMLFCWGIFILTIMYIFE